MGTRANDLAAQVAEACRALDTVAHQLNAALEDPGRLDIVNRVRRHRRTTVGLNRLCVAGQASLDVPICLVTLLDDKRQEFIGSYGLPDHLRSAGSSVDESLCQYVVATGEMFEVGDIRAQRWLCETVPGAGLGTKAYLGAPWRVEGEIGGSFCALDYETRVWTDEEKATITDLAARAAEIVTDGIG